MQLPSILQGESLTRLLQGAAAGAVATMFVGFYWGGWSLGSTADKMAKERSDLAVVSALAPVCADKFRALPDGEAKAVALSKVDSWKRRDEFPKEIVTLPGESYPSSALVDACSTLLLAPKSAALKWYTATERKFLRRSSGLLSERTKRSLKIAGRNTSISVEDDFWSSLQEIAKARHQTLSYLVGSINAERRNSNLSSAIRLFVLGFYRDQLAAQPN
jgi:predicted DNA-binding ribbon-helix-helix protein